MGSPKITGSGVGEGRGGNRAGSAYQFLVQSKDGLGILMLQLLAAPVKSMGVGRTP